jgi:hypothetical protein
MIPAGAIGPHSRMGAGRVELQPLPSVSVTPMRNVAPAAEADVRYRHTASGSRLRLDAVDAFGLMPTTSEALQERQQLRTRTGMLDA